LFFTRKIKDKTVTTTTRKKTLDREKGKMDNNHVPTSVDIILFNITFTTVSPEETSPFR